MLPTGYRLPSPEITRVMRSGKRITGNSQVLSLVYRKQERDSSTGDRDDNGRFAFIVSTNIDKRATERNRIKRLMREAVQHVLAKITIGYDYIMIARQGAKGRTQKEIEEEVNRLLEQAKLIE